MKFRFPDRDHGTHNKIRAPQYGYPKYNKVREVNQERRRISQDELVELAELMQRAKS